MLCKPHGLPVTKHLQHGPADNKTRHFLVLCPPALIIMSSDGAVSRGKATPAKRSGGRPGRLKLLLGGSTKKLKKDHKPDAAEDDLPSSPCPQSPAKQSPAAAASPSDAGTKRAAALPPTLQLPGKQAKFAGSRAADAAPDKPVPRGTPTAVQSPAAAAAAPSAAEAEPVEPLQAGDAEREVVPHAEGHALEVLQLLEGPGDTQEEEVSEMLTASEGMRGATVDPLLQSPGLTGLPEGSAPKDWAPEVVKEAAQHVHIPAAATQQAHQSAVKQAEELASTASPTASHGAAGAGPALPALPALAAPPVPELARLAAAPLPGHAASPSPEPPKPVAGPKVAPVEGPEPSLGATAAAPAPAPAGAAASGMCGAAGDPAEGSPAAPGRSGRRLRRQGGMKGSSSGQGARQVAAAARPKHQPTAATGSDAVMQGPPGHLKANLEVGLLDPDTLALLSEKTRQALDARSAAAAAQQAITQLTLEQGARQAEAQDARRKLAALAALLPSPLPPAAAAFEGGGEDAHVRLADLQAQLAATQGFLQRAAALNQEGSELSKLLGMLHAVQAARTEVAAPQVPELVAAALDGAVVAVGQDAISRCEAAAEAATQLLAAADAAVAGWVLPGLEELKGRLQREEMAQALQAEQLEREVDGYKTLVMHLPAIQRQRSVEASLRGAERALREIEAKLEAARAGLREASAKYTQLSALCNRIRMG